MRKYIDWTLDKLNLKIDNNQKWILFSLIVAGLIHTYISPTLTKEIISNLPAQWIAFEALVSSVTGLIIGVLWKGDVRKKAIKYFLGLISTESIAGCLLAFYLAFVQWNVWVFAIVSLIYTNLISIFVSKCVMAFKAKLWIEREREIYDNNASIVAGITCILGFGSALLFLPSLKFALVLWGLACIIDDLGWGIVYYRNKQELNKLENEEE